MSVVGKILPTNSRVRKTKQNRLMLLSNCAACGKKSQGSLKIKNFSK